MDVIIVKSKPAIDIYKLQQIEQIVVGTLPQEYKNFLLRYNGGRPQPASFAIYWDQSQEAKHWDSGEVDYFLSIHDGEYSNFEDYYSTYNNRIPDDTLAIGYDAGGNLILIGVGEINFGKIFFWMHSYELDEPDYSNVGFVASSFNEFINSLYEGE